MDSIVAGIRRFREEVFPGHAPLFEELRAGQSPQLLLVTCSDSRIDPALLTQTDPGEVFVLRNAGNLVPAAGASPGAEAATVEYAVEVLGIRDIAVCGHSHCGAMAALADPESAGGLPAVQQWLEHGRPALDRVAAFRSLDDPALRVVAANVIAQVENLRTHPSVRAAEESGELRLHAWLYRFECGEVVEVDPAGALRPLTGRPLARRASTPEAAATCS